ncbi:MFS transporter [Cupriavidus taiwanensis]|uniref:MFS transporter n=1 Tax=Cupriavidus taiwanensis TaxID=164546 RepID=UPI000E106A97|nr:MFS transporter [Cupriavidus taiwanensis]SOY72629.1 putative MFS transporter; Major Facilitator Superfamily [Cupriavidus taiwanensis]SOY72822.1 putative MFS transporter; Major Facilitator Superfamily [Cupriavidus taiwanensis]SOY96723.1 putative MFS transporter; Major Facilitator Superfamily [Cupriavidus taiwanensis]SOZ66637.1 putative MFS transporter; Major Facilitator Superfamily [Cupriavidus taiwanensis]SOZ83879.1 putative MFS transporter; Major Facilitator Superfamily [Cupriavidus taiwan
MPSPFLLPVLALCVCMVGAAEFMLAPMLAPLASAFNTSPAHASGLVSAYALSYAAAAPLMGWLSDRAGRRGVLLTAMLLFAVDSIALTLVPTLRAAMALRILSGLAAAATIPTVFAVIADRIPQARQAGAMGGVMLGMTAGIAAGPAVAGLLVEAWGWRAPFMMIAVSCLAAFTAGWHVIPRDMPRSCATGKLSSSKKASSGIFTLLLAKGAWNGSAVAGYVFAGEVLRMRYQLEVGSVGIAVSVFGLGLAIGNMLAGHASRRYQRDENTLFFAAVVVAGSMTLFLTAAIGLPAALGCLLVWGAALGIAAPASTAILAQRGGANKGKVLAASESVNNVAVLVLLPVAASASATYGVTPAAALLGGLCLAGAILSATVRRTL